MLAPGMTDVSVVMQSSARGWHYVVHRGMRTETPTLSQVLSARFGLAATREQAYACALAEVRGILRCEHAPRRA